MFIIQCSQFPLWELLWLTLLMGVFSRSRHIVDIVVLIKYWKSQHSLKHKTQRHYYKLTSYQHNFQETVCLLFIPLNVSSWKASDPPLLIMQPGPFQASLLAQKRPFLGDFICECTVISPCQVKANESVLFVCGSFCRAASVLYLITEAALLSWDQMTGHWPLRYFLTKSHVAFLFLSVTHILKNPLNVCVQSVDCRQWYSNLLKRVFDLARCCEEMKERILQSSTLGFLCSLSDYTILLFIWTLLTFCYLSLIVDFSS